MDASESEIFRSIREFHIARGVGNIHIDETTVNGWPALKFPHFYRATPDDPSRHTHFTVVLTEDKILTILLFFSGSRGFESSLPLIGAFKSISNGEKTPVEILNLDRDIMQGRAMSVTVYCKCGSHFTSTDANQGRKFRCKKCQQPVVFPRHDAAERVNFPDDDLESALAGFDAGDWGGTALEAPAPQGETQTRAKGEDIIHAGGGRTYVHDKCGNGTHITGSAFSAVASGYSRVRMTMCAACNKYDYLCNFSWADTGGGTHRLPPARQTLHAALGEDLHVGLPILCGIRVWYFMWTEKMRRAWWGDASPIGGGIFMGIMSRIIIVGLLLQLFADDLYKNE